MAEEIFEGKLFTTDWNEEWKALQHARGHADSPEVWNKKAATFPVKHGSQSQYVRRFIELADIKPRETVLDMGCGTGAIATPLALGGNPVIACDFSQGMLDAMVADQEQLNVSGVTPLLLSWDDDWDNNGLPPKSVDVAIASRSIATYDLKESLMKLSRVARRRACITLPAGPSPKSDPELLAAAGFRARAGHDFQYAFNILVSNDILPEVSYIPSMRIDRFSSFQEALDTLSGIARDAVRSFASESEIATIPARLEPWLSESLEQTAGEAGYSLTREVIWDFLAWNTR